MRTLDCLRAPLVAAVLLTACSDDGASPGTEADASGDDTTADAGDTTADAGDTTADADDTTADADDTTADADDTTADAGDTTADTGAPIFGPPDPACVGDLAPGTAVEFATGFETTEGAAFGPDGLLYVSGGGVIHRVAADGSHEPLAEVASALGLAPVADGLVAAQMGASTAPTVVDGGMARIALDGTVTVLSTTIPSGNAVLVTPTGSVLVSDDFAPHIYLVSPAGETVDLLTSVASPNGMAYSPDGTTFYVASTFTTRGEVTAFDVDGSGLPVDGTGREIARLGNGSTPDGMAVDARGRVYVAANLQRRIARIDPATGQTVNVVTGLSTPASMAFGRGPGFDPCSIYVTSLSGPSVYRVVLDTPGAPVTYPTGG